MITDLLITIIRWFLPALVGLVIYGTVYLVLGIIFVVAAGYTITQTAVIEVAITVLVFVIDTD